MASSRAATALLLLLNLVFFTVVSSADVACPPSPPPPAKDYAHKDAPKPTGDYAHKETPSPSGDDGHKDAPSPTGPKDGHKGKCPKDTLKLRVCANLLDDLKLVNLVVGTPPKSECCPLIEGLADLEAAVCLCTAIKANVLGINLNAKVSLSLLLNYCDKKVPSGFKC